MAEQASIVCVHVGDGNRPVLVITLERVDGDLMWCLTCGGGAHPTSEGRMSGLERMIEMDPSLRAVCDTMQEGQIATRKAPGQPWLVEPLPAEDEAA